MPRSLPKPKVSTAVSNPFAEGFSSAALAHSIVAAVVHEAQKRSVRVCVAVVDSGGHLLAFLRMDGLPFHLISIAQDKAVTSASFGVPTSELAFGMARHSKAVIDFFRAREHLVLLGGGVPLRVGGQLIGAIGVSGSSEAEDEACALAAAKACLDEVIDSK